MNTEIKGSAEKLRLYREACALSQQQVADALGINRTTYTKYETGSGNLKLDKLVKIAAIFNIPAETLLPESSDGIRHIDKVSDCDLSEASFLQLSSEERGLIALYRTLSGSEKQKAAEMMSEMSKKHEKKD